MAEADPGEDQLDDMGRPSIILDKAGYQEGDLERLIQKLPDVLTDRIGLTNLGFF